MHTYIINYFCHYYALGRCAKYCDQRVCMYVCLFVCRFAYLLNHVQISRNFLYMLDVSGQTDRQTNRRDETRDQNTLTVSFVEVQ